jgi:uncharacterized protein YceH (UPF0502 family)
MNAPIVLTPIETRVLGVMIEKEQTVPDIYPLSLNALTSGCNQKNNREPVTRFTEEQVQAALNRLKALSFAIESSGARVTRFSHNVDRVLRIPSQSVAILAVLMLRGPQTSGELRINAERLHRFADVSSVEAFLEELATRPDAQGGALVVKQARQPGEREQRWAHRLSGDPIPVSGKQAAEPVSEEGSEIAALRAEVARLADEVAQLRAAVARVQQPTGLPGQER